MNALRFVPSFPSSLGLRAVAALALFSCCFAGPIVVGAHAQDSAEAAKVTATLPAEAQTVLNRLGSLGNLPQGQWRLHVGDMAHGESIGLDDSAWAAAVPKAKISKDALWFRQVVAIPPTLNGYDLTGARIWFQFHADSHGPMPEILYFNGRRVALGDDLEPIVLLEDARPGEKITVAVKLLHTVDEKSYLGADLRIEFPANRPSPTDLRTEFLSAAVLIPSLKSEREERMDPMATLASDIEVVDLKALDGGDQAKFDASLKASRQRMALLRPLLQQVTMHLTGNSHIDAAWLWPWTETVDVVKRTFGTALQLMYEYPQYTYTQSAAAYNDWMAQKYPEINDQIKDRIHEGRWEVVGGMWVEPDLNLPDGESLVRQLLVGKRWFKQAYGVDVRIGWNPDSFGYTWQLPQIYKKSGVDYFVTQKMTWNDTNQLPFKLFWWESPDGSKVLAYFPHDYANDSLNPLRLSADMAAARAKATGLTEMMDLYGVGDHGGGPTRAILDEGMHWEEAAKEPAAALPKFQFGVAQSFFSSVEKQIAPESKEWDYASIAKGYTPPASVPGMVSIPTWKSEMYFEYHRGVMTTQANHKRNMREASIEVLNAEKWSSLAWVLSGPGGRAYPGSELTEDWKKVLFNQFHDLAAGSGIGIIYKEAQKDYDAIRWSTNEIDAGALETISNQIDTSGGLDPILISNPLAWSRSGEVTVRLRFDSPRKHLLFSDPRDHIVDRRYEEKTGITELKVHVNDIPALGYKVIRIDSKDPKSVDDPQAAGPNVKSLEGSFVIENQSLSTSIDKTTGCITSLVDRHSKAETIAPKACGNELQFFKDTPKDYDAWNIDPGTLDIAPSTVGKADSVEQVGNAIRVTRTWQKSKFVQTISLANDEVDIDNEIDWHETHVLLKAAFPLAVTSDHATYDIPYGEIERTTERTNSWEKAQFEVPAQYWADYSGTGSDGKVHGLSIFNESKFGYDAAGNVLRLTLLRSPTWPDAEADRGHHHFRFALYPHAGTWADAMTVRRGFEYNYPLAAVVTTAHPGTLPPSHSFVSVTPDNVVLTAVKKAEDANGLIFRVYEWAGKASTVEFHVPPGATGATVTNMQETPEGDALTVDGDAGKDPVVKVAIKPYEILTVRVDYAEKK